MGEGKEPNENELWGLAYKRAVRWTMKRHRLGLADAEEVVQEAIRQSLSAEQALDPSKPDQLQEILGSRINGIAVNRRRKKSTRSELLTADGSPVDGDSPEPLEHRIASNEVARRLVTALLARVEDDEVVASLVLLIAEGIEDPADQAKALGRDVLAVYNARRRLKTHADAIEKLAEEW